MRAKKLTCVLGSSGKQWGPMEEALCLKVPRDWALSYGESNERLWAVTSSSAMRLAGYCEAILHFLLGLK